MSFDDFMNDKVTFLKKDGSFERKDINASVQKNKLITLASDLPIEVGDHFLRQLPSGLAEDYIVESPNFNSGFATIPSHWDVRVRRTNEPLAKPEKVISTIIGNGARVYVDSTDKSKNKYVINSENVFSELSKALREGVAEQNKRDEILNSILKMQKAHKEGNFPSSYAEFIKSASEHMTIVAPFLPALAQFF